MQRRFLSWAAQMGLLLCCVLLSGTAFHAGAQALRIGGTGGALGTVRLLADAFAKQNPTLSGLTVVPNLGSSGGLCATLERTALEGDARSCTSLAQQVYDEFSRAEIEFNAYL